MSGPKTYQGFWSMRSGEAIEELVDFLRWDREDWARFEQWMDELEKKPIRGKHLKRAQWHRTISNLTKSELIERRRIAGRLMVRLTDKGWRSATISRIRYTKVRCKNGFCIVAYDIPEEHKAMRHQFRIFLASCAFTQLQRSVWASPRDVTDLICQVVDSLGIKPWVTVIEGNIKRTQRRIT